MASAAVSAMADPDRLASITEAPMVTYPSPPLMWPTRLTARLMMRWEMPPAFISSPARMKKGTAISG